MINWTNYTSPLGNITLASKDNALIGLWLEGQKYTFSNYQDTIIENPNDSVLVQTKKWLDLYFDGKNPNVNQIKLAPIGSPFRQKVWQLLLQIPYGTVVTYNELAKNIAKQMGITKMSPQAIGNAVGHNPISIIIPCHRVVGSKGSLTGYAGGIDKKLQLLKHEQVDMRHLFVSKKGTAL